MLVKSVRVDGGWSLANYRQLLATDRTWALLRNSLVLAAWTTGLTTAIGVPLAVLLGKSDLPGRAWLILLFSVPLLPPPYIAAVAWSNLLSTHGALQRVSGTWLAEWAWNNLFGLPGCVLVLFSTLLPFFLLLTMASLRSIDPRLEEAGRIVARWPAVLKGITLPLILPGILLAATLVFLLSLGELGVPLFLRYNVFAVESFTEFSAFLNFGLATAAAVPLALLTLLALGLEWLVLGEKLQVLRPAAGHTLHVALGRLRTPVFVAVVLLCTMLVVLPLSALLFQAGSGAAYREALGLAADSLVRSVAYAGTGACLLTAFGFLLGYLLHTRALQIWRAADALTLLLFATPGAVIGIGLVTLWNRPATSLIYATPLIILLGYMAQYAALTSRAVSAALAQVPNSMEEAAEVMGAGWLRRVVWITAPLCWRGLLAAWLVAYIFCLRDLSISMLVYPPGRDTFPVRIFTLMANSPAERIAALCVILVAATLVPLGALALLLRRERTRRVSY